MKIINKIIIGIAVICLLLCGGILVFAMNPDMTDALAQRLYGNGNNAETATETAEAIGNPSNIGTDGSVSVTLPDQPENSLSDYINPNPQEPLRYPGGNTGSSDSVTAATPAPRSDAVTDLNSYYANCITQLSILGSGDQHFDNVVSKSLWSTIEQAYNTGAYEQGYVAEVLKKLGNGELCDSAAVGRPRGWVLQSISQRGDLLRGTYNIYKSEKHRYLRLSVLFLNIK